MATLYVRDEGRGPAVLFIHGYPLGSWMWDDQVRAVTAAGRRALAPDLRGFGASPLPAEPCGIDAYADDCVAVLRERGIERAMVVGFSMGGYVALSIAERHPQVLQSLVLADTKAAPDTEEGKRGRTAAAERALKEGSAPIAEAMAQKLFAPKTLQENAALVDDVRARMTRVEPAAIACALAAMRDRPDRRGALPSVAVPALVIVGSEDALTPPAEAEAMRAAIPGARLVTIEGAGHMSNLERPGEFNAALVEFLAGSGTGSGSGSGSAVGETSDLALKACIPCKGGTPPLRGEALAALAKRLGGGWRLLEERALEKEYRFKNFREALDFTIRVGEIAEREKHHPDIYLAWGKVRLKIWTHKIDGLTESDFVLAAKADAAAAR